MAEYFVYNGGLYSIDELYHYGVKGMKWGVRRYQNSDGSLTENGRLRIKGANRKSSLIKEQLGMDIDKRVFYKHDKDASKSVSLNKGEKSLSRDTKRDQAATRWTGFIHFRNKDRSRYL